MRLFQIVAKELMHFLKPTLLSKWGGLEVLQPDAEIRGDVVAPD